jgi:CubicO group peptidase (beta-lactamase class C family)
LRTDEALADKVTRITKIPLHHQPGLRFTYSIATDVLGHLVELVSGMPLDVFFRNRIFGPLGMVDTGFSVPPEKLARLATVYTLGPSGGLVDVSTLPRAARPQFLRDAWVDKTTKPLFLSGGGGLVSTTMDYLRFALMLANKGALNGTRLVSRKTVELMTARHLSSEQFPVPGYGCGLGLTILTDPVQAQILGSAGAYGGGGAANTEFWVDPTEGLVGVLMTQYVAPTPSGVTMDFKTLAAQAIAD